LDDEPTKTVMMGVRYGLGRAFGEFEFQLSTVGNKICCLPHWHHDLFLVFMCAFSFVNGIF
jgi:hypothetical protein